MRIKTLKGIPQGGSYSKQCLLFSGQVCPLLYRIEPVGNFWSNKSFQWFVDDDGVSVFASLFGVIDIDD